MKGKYWVKDTKVKKRNKKYDSEEKKSRTIQEKETQKTKCQN